MAYSVHMNISPDTFNVLTSDGRLFVDADNMLGAMTDFVDRLSNIVTYGEEHDDVADLRVYVEGMRDLRNLLSDEINRIREEM